MVDTVITAIVLAPHQTQAWLDTNNPLLPSGATFWVRGTQLHKTNTTTTPQNWNSLLYDEQGPQGNPGQSAYDLDVAQGFVGDLDEWLLSLQGEKGDPGDSFNFVKGHTIPSTQDVRTLYGRY